MADNGKPELTKEEEQFITGMPPCGTCRFFQPGEGKLGQCRLDRPNQFILVKPMKLAVGAGGGQGFQVDFPAAWPIVPEDAWCGQHKPKASIVH